jgi:CRP-like cAMP-binding protein
MARRIVQKHLSFDPEAFPAAIGVRPIQYARNQVVFAQGDDADSLFYIQDGKVKLTVVSETGQSAVLAILGLNDFFGESCLAGQGVRLSTATSLSDSSIFRISVEAMESMLVKQPAFAALFTAHLLSRMLRLEGDLLDHLFNSSEKRLARVLLLLANCGEDREPETALPRISQETLAQMVGTTRPRVNYFLNKFRKLGLIEYKGGLKVHGSLRTVVLHDRIE